MIELIIKKFLDQHLKVPVYLEAQRDGPDRYVIFEKTTGSENNHIKTATVAVQSYGKSLYDSAVLNEEVKQAMLALDTIPEISGVSLNADYNFTDIETKRYRYQAVFDINYY